MPFFRRKIALSLFLQPLLLTVFLARGNAEQVAPPAAAQAEVEECLGCHSDASLEKVLPDGGKLSLTVDAALFAKSVHGSRGCTGCHRAEREVPHPATTAKSVDELRSAFGETCRHCHFENFTRALDGVHHAQRMAGNSGAPTCIDCHGSHDIGRAGRPRARVSQTCAGCHSDIFDVYAKSIHGRALLEEGKEDVPVCTDCHRSHDIADPKNRRWLMSTPEACGRCHSDETRMAKYKLSTKVVDTYLADFHGMSASLYKGQKQSEMKVVALCTDCHGVHDIASTRGVDAAKLKANVLRACRKCHPDASPNFPAAWLSHYQPSPTKAPLVWFVTLFYKGLIPFMLVGLVLQILLHLWRAVVNK
jgi:nitrate/TMAO reductase-like tetraheme cytochrome c subunit